MKLFSGVGVTAGIAGSGTAGKLPLFSAGTTLGDSHIADSGTVLTASERLVTLASAVGAAGLNVPHGTAPTSPVNGDVWTTTAGIFVRVNGVTVGPLSVGGSSVLQVSDPLVLTDAQIKALPETAIEIVPAQSGRLALPVFSLLESNFAGGAYSSIDADSYITLAYTGDYESFSYLLNESGGPTAYLTDFLGSTTAKFVPLMLSQQFNAAWGLLGLPTLRTHGFGLALNVFASNNGTTHFGGGHVDNTLTVTAWYLVI